MLGSPQKPILIQLKRTRFGPRQGLGGVIVKSWAMIDTECHSSMKVKSDLDRLLRNDLVVLRATRLLPAINTGSRFDGYILLR